MDDNLIPVLTFG